MPPPPHKRLYISSTFGAISAVTFKLDELPNFKALFPAMSMLKNL